MLVIMLVIVLWVYFKILQFDKLAVVFISQLFVLDNICVNVFIIVTATFAIFGYAYNLP